MSYTYGAPPSEQGRNDDAHGPTESTPLLLAHDHSNEHDSEDVSKMTMFWQEMRTIPSYALPVFGAQILEYSLFFVPVVSIGHISTTALAAISLGSMTAGVTGLSMAQGLSTALDTLLPTAWTSPEPHLMGLWAQRMGVVMTFMLLPPIYLIWFNAEQVLLFLKQDPEVARLASLYLRWFSIGLPAFCFNCISRRYFQSQGLFSVQTWIICFVAPINILLNYLLVWGPEPIRLGFVGAPITTAISYTLISLISVLYGIYYMPKKAWHPLSSQMFTNLGIVVRLGIAGIGQTASEWWAWELVALLASYFGPTALASQSVLLTTASTLFQASFGLANATSIRIGNLLGERKAKRAGVASNTAIFIAFIVCSMTSTILIVSRHTFPYIFNDDPEVVKRVAGILPIIAFFQLVDGNAAVTAGILRAKGDQFIGAILNLSAYYVIGFPIGIWLAFRAHMELPGLWIGLTLSLVYCSVVGTYLCLKTDWDWEVKRVIERNRMAEGDEIPKLSDV